MRAFSLRISSLFLFTGLNALTNFVAIGLYLTIPRAGGWLGAAIWDLRTTPAASRSVPATVQN